MPRVSTSIKKALTDGRVEKVEVDGLIKGAQQDGKVTNTERKQLTDMLEKSADKFAPEARSSLAAFLGNPGPISTTEPVTPAVPAAPPASQVPLKDDPAPLLKHSSTPMEEYPGELFVDGVNFDDVLQGQIANCFMVSAFSAVAYAHPEAIEQAIKDNGDGTYDVRLFEKGPSGKWTPVSFRIDGDLPMGFGGPLYAKSRSNRELWVSLLEKAYAVEKKGYEFVGNGGLATDVMSTLTGTRSFHYPMSTMEPGEVFSLIQESAASKCPMAAGTHGEDSGINYSGTGVHAWHCYTVLGAEVEQGVKYVLLRNPWGQVEPGNDGKNDGIFKMKLSDFVRLYEGVHVNG
ncbi:MAG: hypothetical protein HY901_19220 [Deltaproteobacteria bacterium]|nr:hypothetical protein [Deltaproteobacteria bacterium]